MKKYDITGMSCAACSARVEKAVSEVDGVESCSVNLLTNSMTVSGSAGSADVIDAVQKAGYGASESGADKKDDKCSDASDTGHMIKRLSVSAVLLCVLMYVSMGHVMWGAPLLFVSESNYMAVGLIQLILSSTILVINQKFFINGFKGLVHKAPNMDTLVAFGSGASFVYSVCVMFLMSEAYVRGDSMSAMHYMHDLYFESAAMIVTLITIGKTLEAYSKGKTTNALKSLIDLKPKIATVIKDGKEVEVDASEIQKDDIFVVRPGESFAADAVIVEGSASVDESALTGESIPVDKEPGSKVSAATVNKSGFLKCRATGVGEETLLSQIIQMVSDSSAGKAPIARIADKVSGVFVPVVIVIALLTLGIWLALGSGIGYALARSISVLVISCPCALGLATPVAIMVGNGKGAKNGILFKTAQSLEEAGKTDVVVLDKTGTVTKGEPVITDIVNINCSDETELLTLAYAVESKSEHPLAKAICIGAKNKQIELKEVTDFKALPGSGVEAVLGGDVICAVSFKTAKERFNVSTDAALKYEALASEGKTPLIFAKNNEIIGIIAVADEIKPDSRQAVELMEKCGIKVVMLTGDNKKTAAAIAKKAGIQKVIAGVLPTEKEKHIQSLKKNHKVAMVGDGINDAPALMAADIGIAIGAGSDIAVDSSEVVLMKNTLMDAAGAMILSRAALKNIKENLFWAFIYNTIGIPIAAGAFAFAGLTLSPMLGAAAMSLSSVCVVTNALRLNLVNIYSPKKSRNKKKKEIKSMEKTIRIEGMMCPHCEARVKKALEELSEVESAAASHESGTATVQLKSDISDEALKRIIEEQGYRVM